MMDLLVNIEANIFNIESIIVLCLLMAGVILYSRDFKIGAVVNFVIFGAIFILFYQWGMNYRLPLIIMMVHFVMLSLSLYLVDKTSASRFS